MPKKQRDRLILIVYLILAGSFLAYTFLVGTPSWATPKPFVWKAVAAQFPQE